MSNEPTTAVTAESVSAANPITTETTKTLAETPSVPPGSKSSAPRCWHP